MWTGRRPCAVRREARSPQSVKTIPWAPASSGTSRVPLFGSFQRTMTGLEVRSDHRLQCVGVTAVAGGEAADCREHQSERLDRETGWHPPVGPSRDAVYGRRCVGGEEQRWPGMLNGLGFDRRGGEVPRRVGRLPVVDGGAPSEIERGVAHHCGQRTSAHGGLATSGFATTYIKCLTSSS